MLGRVLRLDAINEGLMLSTPLLVTLATFTTYLASGNTLTLPQVFTTIALFTVLRIPDATALPHPHPDQLQHRLQPAVRVPEQPGAASGTR